MNWKQEDNYHLKSDKGYTISKQFNGEKWLYTAWLRKDMIQGGLGNADEAKEICLNHYNKHYQDHLSNHYKKVEVKKADKDLAEYERQKLRDMGVLK